MKTLRYILITLLCLLAPTAWAADASPAGGYVAFIKALQSANSLSDIDRYFPKRAVETRNKIVDALPEENDRGQVYNRLLEEMKSTVGDVKVTSANEDTSRPRGKSPAGNITAVVAVKGVRIKTGKPIDRWPIMELENGVWKFSGSVQALVPPPTSAVHAATVTTTTDKASGSVVVEPLPPERITPQDTR
ncbi:MAG: hypothetical protein ACYC9J_14670 [Sulfuricaulis sp.]